MQHNDYAIQLFTYLVLNSQVSISKFSTPRLNEKTRWEFSENLHLFISITVVIFPVRLQHTFALPVPPLYQGCTFELQ